MRLTEEQRRTIKQTVALHDAAAKVYLFGSRVDDQGRGGDIDLLIFSEVLGEGDRRALRLALYDQLGEQKIDLLIAKDMSSPFVRIAYKNSVLL